jgi:hypothetical protein
MVALVELQETKRFFFFKRLHYGCFISIDVQLFPSYKATPSAMKMLLYKSVPALKGDNLVVFYYLSASEIWSEKRGWPLLGGAL